jgi:hypothetical protein
MNNNTGQQHFYCYFTLFYLVLKLRGISSLFHFYNFGVIFSFVNFMVIFNLC